MICCHTDPGRRTGSGAASCTAGGWSADRRGSAERQRGRRQDMSEPSPDAEQVRPEVVEAIVGVLKGGDPEDLPPGATSAEKAAAKDAYLSDFLAERSKRDR